MKNQSFEKNSKSEKFVAQREMKESCSEKCRLYCGMKISKEERELLFKEYWALGDLRKQRTYISNSMTNIIPKYRYLTEEEGKRRRPKNAFHFNLQKKKVRVCKTFFKNTLDITDGSIRTVLDKKIKAADTLIEGNRRSKRGNHTRRGN